MCEPVTASLLIGSAVGMGSAAAGAGTMMAIGAGAAAGLTAFAGISSANASVDAGYAQAHGYFQSSEEMMKQIQHVETQALNEEIIRRDQFAYLTQKNLVAASTTGARADSETFEAIQKRNERIYRHDNMIADLNEVNAKGQLAGQAKQFTTAGFATIKGARDNYIPQLAGVGASILTNAPVMATPSFGRGTVNPGGGNNVSGYRA